MYQRKTARNVLKNCRRFGNIQFVFGDWRLCERLSTLCDLVGGLCMYGSIEIIFPCFKVSYLSEARFLAIFMLFIFCTIACLKYYALKCILWRSAMSFISGNVFMAAWECVYNKKKKKYNNNVVRPPIYTTYTNLTLPPRTESNWTNVLWMRAIFHATFFSPHTICVCPMLVQNGCV